MTIGLLFLSYIIIRTFSVGATYDEIATIRGPVMASFLDPFVNMHPTANNHLLNTILIKILFSTGNKSLPLARIPNVIAFIIYAYFSYKISFNNLSTTSGIGCFLLLICNPFLLDFFGLARGYGISLAFMMGALYFSLENIHSFSTSKLSQSLIFSALSVVSLLSMIYFFLGIISLSLLIPLLRKNKAAIKASIHLIIIIGGFLGCVIFPHTLRLVRNHGLYYGGHKNFYSDTLMSLARYSMYATSNTTSVHIALELSALILTLTTISSFIVQRKLFSAKSGLIFLITTPTVIIITLHYSLGILYPINRVALFFYPLFILSFYSCLEDLGKLPRVSLSYLTIALSLINLFMNINLNKTALWNFESHTKEILNQINEQGRLSSKIINIKASPILWQSIDYYVEERSYPFIEIDKSPEEDATLSGCDYYILLLENPFTEMPGEPLKKWGPLVNSHNKEIFIKHPQEGIFVLKNTHTFHT